MAQEQLEILKMVADKVITPEEGERLLRALNEGARESAAQQSGARQRKGLGATLTDLLGEMGTMVQDALDQTVCEGFGMSEPEDPNLQEAALGHDGLVLPQGTSLLVRHRPQFGPGARHADLHLVGTGGDRLAVSGQDAGVRAYLGEGRAVVAFGRGPLEVRVPGTVATLKAFSATGEVRASGLSCPAELKTMSGGILLEQVIRATAAKTMGGSVQLGLARGLEGDCQVVTLGGDVELRVAEGVAAVVHATTMGGQVEVDPSLGAVRREAQRMAKSVWALGVAPGAAAPAVHLKTMGGGIRLKRA